MPIIDRCPKCNRRASIPATETRYGYCSTCRMQFDNDPDEGGDYGNNPELRMEREERTRK